MLFLRKLLKLPSPIELGWSDHDALEDEGWSDPPFHGKTWQDWRRTVKSMHPIKYWIAETVGDFLRYKIWLPMTRPFETARYWLVSHLVPKRRYHMLDLRQPGPEGYKYGWCDVPEKMLYAMFNMLNQFVEGELINYYCPSEKEIAEASSEDEAFILQRQRDYVFEVKSIHRWWNIERPQMLSLHQKTLNEWYSSRKTDTNKAEKRWELMKRQDLEFENKTDEMIARLMKVRRSMWT